LSLPASETIFLSWLHCSLVENGFLKLFLGVARGISVSLCAWAYAHKFLLISRGGITIFLSSIYELRLSWTILVSSIE